MRARSWWAPASCDIGGLAAILSFRREAEKADLLHLHYPWPFADMMWVLSGVRKPAVVTYHADVVEKGLLGVLYRPMMRRTLNRCRLVIATSDAYVNSSQALRLHVPQERLRTIPLGIAEGSYADALGAAAEVAVEERFACLKSPYMLFLGVLRRYKGIDMLLRAAEKTGVPTVIAGSGPEAGRVKQAAREVENICFVGQVSDAEKMALLRNCRAVILPSITRAEAFGMVLIEGAMCGKAMVSTELGTGTSFVNEDGVTGFVVHPGSVDELAEAMRVLVDDAELAKRMGAAARVRYERLFSDEALGKGYFEAYQEALGKGMLAP